MSGPRYLVVGAGGMLGRALCRVLDERDIPYLPRTHIQLDLTDGAAIEEAVSAFASRAGGFAAVINAAAYTDVEGAEDDEAAAFAVNERGALDLAGSAATHGLTLAHVSTDFVFDGEKNGAYTESDEPNPLSVYGASKLAGERAVAATCPDALIVRTAWVFGHGGSSFPATMSTLARTRDTLQVVTDEVGSPTYTIDLARGILGLLDADANGLFHLAGAGSCSRYELAEKTLRIIGLDTHLEPTTSDAFPTKAARPRNSVLDCSRAGRLGVTMPPWDDGLARFLVAEGLVLH